MPTTCTSIVAGVYVARPPVTNFAGINLFSANAAHPLQNCRLSYSQIQMEPQRLVTYLGWRCMLQETDSWKKPVGKAKAGSF